MVSLFPFIYDVYILPQQITATDKNYLIEAIPFHASLILYDFPMAYSIVSTL
jgi:hypothetical protein